MPVWRCREATPADFKPHRWPAAQPAAGIVVFRRMIYSGAQPPNAGGARRRLGVACLVGLLVSLACAVLIWMTYDSLPPDLKMIAPARLLDRAVTH
jgi:hypothetical protein